GVVAGERPRVAPVARGPVDARRAIALGMELHAEAARADAIGLMRVARRRGEQRGAGREREGVVVPVEDGGAVEAGDERLGAPGVGQGDREYPDFRNFAGVDPRAEPARQQLRAEAEADGEPAGARGGGEERGFVVEPRLVGGHRAAEDEHEIVAGAVARGQGVAGPATYELDAHPAALQRGADEAWPFVLGMFDHEGAHVGVLPRAYGRVDRRANHVILIVMDGLVTFAVIAFVMLFAASLPYVFVETRWRWRWREIEAGRVAADRGAPGVYRAAGDVPRY